MVFLRRGRSWVYREIGHPDLLQLLIIALAVLGAVFGADLGISGFDRK